MDPLFLLSVHLTLFLVYVYECYLYNHDSSKINQPNLHPACRRKLSIYNAMQVLINTFFLIWIHSSLNFMCFSLRISFSPYVNPNVWLLNMNELQGSKNFLLKWYTYSRYIPWIETWILMNAGKRLAFFHVWHHSSVPLVAFVGVQLGASFPSGIYFLIWNCLTHVCLYTWCLVGGRKPFSKKNAIKVDSLITMLILMEYVLVILQSYMGIFYKTPFEQTPSFVFAIQGLYYFFLLYFFVPTVAQVLFRLVLVLL